MQRIKRAWHLITLMHHATPEDPGHIRPGAIVGAAVVVTILFLLMSVAAAYGF